MIGRQVVNLFDKNSSEIVFRARLSTDGVVFGPGVGNNTDEVRRIVHLHLISSE